MGDRSVLLLTEAFYDYYVFRAPEASVPVAVVDYSLSNDVADSGKVLQFLGGRGVQINALLVRLSLRNRGLCNLPLQGRVVRAGSMRFTGRESNGHERNQDNRWFHLSCSLTQLMPVELGESKR